MEKCQWCGKEQDSLQEWGNKKELLCDECWHDRFVNTDPAEMEEN